MVRVTAPFHDSTRQVDPGKNSRNARPRAGPETLLWESDAFALSLAISGR